ncbi:MAG: hypothetical protein IK066_04680 [Kiritimatiellae bacterium]|nr:hypothetical protein [Kiritimatiellia bacterium]
MTLRPLAEGLRSPVGVAVHPVSGHVYVSESDTGRILDISASKASALPDGWSVSTEYLPKWAITEAMPVATWHKAALDHPGAISIGTNGYLYVTEQIPNGRLLGFIPDESGAWGTAHPIPVPWLDQEFQWRNVQIDSSGRLFIAGTDEIGNPIMKFGSALMRDSEGDWWVLDHGPFAQFNTFALSDKEDFMLLGDMDEGTLTWWELNKHLMLGGTPSTTTRDQSLAALAIYPDGAFLLGIVAKNGGSASLVRLDPFTQQQTVLSTDLKSIGAIAMDRRNNRYIVTDPVAGRVLECTFDPPLQFTEGAINQIVRAAAGVAGFAGAAEAPAFLNTFMDRLQNVFKEDMDSDSSHAVSFNISDIVGKLPIIAGRIQAIIEVEDVEEDPLETIEFFLLFPSHFVMTDATSTPSLSFFSAKRKSGKLEQTRPLFTNSTAVYRFSGTNVARLATSSGGLHVPVVSCGLDQADGGIYVHLAFLGMGIYSDYMLDLFQSPAEQRAKITVPSPSEESGLFTYEASFLQDIDIEGAKGVVKKETISNLLIAGFESGGGGGNRSIGWLRIGRFPASMMVGFGDTFAEVTGAQAEMQSLLDKKRIELSMESAAEITGDEDEDNDPLAPGAQPSAGPADAPASPDGQPSAGPEPAPAEEAAP